MECWRRSSYTGEKNSGLWGEGHWHEWGSSRESRVEAGDRVVWRRLTCSANHEQSCAKKQKNDWPGPLILILEQPYILEHKMVSSSLQIFWYLVELLICTGKWNDPHLGKQSTSISFGSKGCPYCMCNLPAQQLHDLSQGLAGHTALECQEEGQYPLLLWLPRQLMPPLSAEPHAAPMKDREQKSLSSLTVLPYCNSC